MPTEYFPRKYGPLTFIKIKKEYCFFCLHKLYISLLWNTINWEFSSKPFNLRKQSILQVSLIGEKYQSKFWFLVSDEEDSAEKPSDKLRFGSSAWTRVGRTSRLLRKLLFLAEAHYQFCKLKWSIEDSDKQLYFYFLDLLSLSCELFEIYPFSTPFVPSLYFGKGNWPFHDQVDFPFSNSSLILHLLPSTQPNRML